MNFQIDVNEPEIALKLIAPSIEGARVSPLNSQDFADYTWKDYEGKLINVERKTWPEILADVDKVEDQLRRHMKNQPEARLIFVLEGMIEMGEMGTWLIERAKNGTVWTRGRLSGTRLSRIYSWLYQASRYVEVFQTMNYEQTCSLLVAMYKADQKTPEEHKTFSRYFKKVVFHPNSQVTMLMGMSPGLGEVKAEALIGKFGCVWNVLSAEPRELAEVKGIGAGLSKSILQRVGRLDV